MCTIDDLLQENYLKVVKPSAILFFEIVETVSSQSKLLMNDTFESTNIEILGLFAGYDSFNFVQ